MGFSTDTAVTSDSDFLKYFAEQGVDNLLQGSNTWTTTHQGAVNEHIGWLKSRRGISSASDITNNSDHLKLVTAMVLAAIYGSQASRGGALAAKAAYYTGEVDRLRKELPVETADAKMDRRGLPTMCNFDGGTRFPSPGGSKGTKLHEGEIDGYDNRAHEGTGTARWLQS